MKLRCHLGLHIAKPVSLSVNTNEWHGIQAVPVNVQFEVRPCCGKMIATVLTWGNKRV